MTIIQSAFLGVIQGLTEFLPVSSSGHLVLFQKIFGIASGALSFDIFVHLGTLMAIFAVFWKDIVEMIRRPFSRLPLLLVIGTIPAVVVGFAFKDIFENLFSSGSTIGAEFIITGIIILIAEKFACRGKMESNEAICAPKNISSMGALDALVIGAAQSVAILPAISRSGATIAGSLFRGLDRDSALRFSFLLSIPAILGSAVFDVIGTAKNPMPLPLAPIIVGAIAAAISGYFTIRYMLKVFREKPLTAFAFYVFILGGLIIFDQLVTRFVF
ncbi:MAG: undecaprenyl-diphosphate phosphatase [Candidatus Colwellbacteria bacterium]|nr:undecaprenyl-diphosphate phosphatase [Candidatus Colwellbacteria bacterium]